MRTHFGDTRDLFLGFRVALDPRKMVLGLGGLCFGGAGLAALGWLGAQAGLNGAEAELLGERIGQGDLADTWFLMRQGVTRVFCGGTPEPLVPGTALALGFAAFLWWTLVWAFFGGAIARIAAVEIARDERITANEAMQFARERFGSLFWGPTGVVVMVGMLVGFNALLGLAGKIPWAGDFLIALTYPVILMVSLVALLLGGGALLSARLFTPALATEATDAFDCVSRSLSYLYSRPWHCLWYWCASTCYGLISAGLVAAVGWGVITLSLGSVGVGLHAGQGSSRKLERVAEYLTGPLHSEGPVTMGEFMTEFGATSSVLLIVVTVFVVLTAGLVAGFAVSMRYSLSTCLYFLLRHKVDATELDEVWVPEVEREEPPVAPPNQSSAPGPGPEASESTTAEHGSGQAPTDASPDTAEGSEPKSE
jgi:hypothetical protein